MTTNTSAETDRAPRIAVGVDSSEGARHALEWALSTDPSWGTVAPVSVWKLPWWELALAGAAAPVAEVRREHDVDNVLDSIIANLDLTDEQRSRLAERIVIEGPTIDSLIAVAADHDLLVLGTRERGPIADTVLGSVSVRCASEAISPVAVVPHEGGDPNGPVAVGIDGSAHSVAALTWAVEHTAPDVPIIAVGAWTFVVSGAWLDPPVADDPTQEEVTKSVEDVVARVVVDHPDAADRIEVQIQRNDPRAALHAAGLDASMLVIGARGREGWKHALVGSTTTALLHQPPCPIVVIPGD